jgi:abortive infection bacteriophage resistance protein
MNINLNIPANLMERIATALERIADHIELSVKSSIPHQQGEPFGPEYFSTIDNQKSYDQEVEDWLQQTGYGKDYRALIEAEVKRQVTSLEAYQSSSSSPDPNPSR